MMMLLWMMLLIPEFDFHEHFENGNTDEMPGYEK